MGDKTIPSVHPLYNTEIKTFSTESFLALRLT